MYSRALYYKNAISGRKLPNFDNEVNPTRDELHCCELMNMFLEDARIPLNYFSVYREYDIPLLYKGKVTAIQGLFYCPWCGKKLPKSVRDEWFSILEIEYNIDDPYDKKQEKLIPEEFKTDEWWKKRNL